MTAAWFDSSLSNTGLVLVAVLVVLIVARHIILGTTTDRDHRGGLRRPGPPSLPSPAVCRNGDCAAPNRPDAVYCRRCGTKLSPA